MASGVLYRELEQTGRLICRHKTGQLWRTCYEGKKKMQTNDRIDFLALVSDVLAFYKQPFNDFVGNVWWESLKAYDLSSLRRAFSRHAVNPDNGQFAPKPADIVRMMGGTSGDAALSAWSKVERAVRSVGQYASVIFDDALIHRVVEDMGGWVKMCSCPSEDDFIFVAKEFQNRYRGFAMRSERPDYPAGLIGLAQATNAEKGMAGAASFRMLGNAEQCQLVYHHGRDSAGSGQIAMLEVSRIVPRLAGPTGSNP